MIGEFCVEKHTPRDASECDVLVIGGRPAGSTVAPVPVRQGLFAKGRQPVDEARMSVGR